MRRQTCRVCVIVPACNEASSLGMVLDQLAAQTTNAGEKLSADLYEVLLLLNNCTDDSLAVARRAAARHSTLRLHITERTLPGQIAHVGTARRLLMDTAWHRLGQRSGTLAILSTDADTLVAINWIHENLRALAKGADVVGGEICWMSGELAKLSPEIQLAYARDLRYQRLLAELQHHLDPRQEDPMPRHLHHFGASLACTPQAYALAGGLPELPSLEDVAFVSALERSGARIRHEPRVRVFTSGRLEGRVQVGLSGQLRTWQQMSALGEPQIVPSAAWLVHRLRTLHALRRFAQGTHASPVTAFPVAWRTRLLQVRQQSADGAEFLALLPSEAIIEQTFTGDRSGEILAVSRDLEIFLRPAKTSVWTMDGADLIPRDRVPVNSLLTANVPE